MEEYSLSGETIAETISFGLRMQYQNLLADRRKTSTKSFPVPFSWILCYPEGLVTRHSPVLLSGWLKLVSEKVKQKRSIMDPFLSIKLIEQQF